MFLWKAKNDGYDYVDVVLRSVGIWQMIYIYWLCGYASDMLHISGFSSAGVIISWVFLNVRIAAVGVGNCCLFLY